MDGGGVGLLPALCLLRMACVLLTLLTESRLLPSSEAKAAGDTFNLVIQEYAGLH